MTLTATPSPDLLAELTAIHRCDRCGARAYVKVTSPTTGVELLFCGHHATKHEDALATSGFTFHDERARLLAEVTA